MLYVSACSLQFSSGRLRLCLTFGSGVGTVFWDMLSNTTIQAGIWTHIAIVRNGTYFITYVNGVEDTALRYTGTDTLRNIPDLFTIGWELNQPSANYYGYIDEFSLSKGYARWTSNFTPPNSPYNYVPAFTIISPTQNSTLFQSLKTSQRSV